MSADTEGPGPVVTSPDDPVTRDDHKGAPAADAHGDDEGTGAHAERRSRRRFLIAGGVVTALLLGGGGAAVLRGGGDHAADDAAAAATGPSTATVERRTLEERTELDGTLGYGEVSDVSLAAQGTITGLPPIGSVVDRGQTLVEVDGRAVPLLFGDRPMWRELRDGVDDGPDVEQLEANLVALGIVSASELSVDQEWTDATTEAVEDWQASLDRDDTGVVAPGDVVFLPAALRVAEHPVAVGGQVGESVLGVTSATHLVTVDLEASRRSLLQPGQQVGIVLPDGTTITGRVYSVGNVATAADSGDPEGGAGGGAGGEGDQEPTIDVVVALDDPAASGGLDGAPVTVQVVTSAAENVMAVPVEALLALAEGGYAVELAHADGTTDLVGVELGAFADGWVEVTGEVAEGDEVVVPGD
jgi:hypothetical protein